MNRKIICKNSGCTGKTINLRSGDVKVNLSGAEVNSGDAKLTLVHLVQRFIRPLASHTRTRGRERGNPKRAEKSGPKHVFWGFF